MQESYAAVYRRPWAASASATSSYPRAQAHTNIPKKDVWIAILGRSGSGKTSLVNQIIGSRSDGSKAPDYFEVGSGGSMNSCTKQIQVSPPIPLDDTRQLRLIDTVAFDNDDRTDYDVLVELSDHLSSLYRKKIVLNGVILLHRISDVRMGGSPKINFDMALKICGEEFYPNIVLMTTKWSKAGPTPVEVKREEDLKTNPRLFHPLLVGGGTYMRYDGTAESVWKAVEKLSRMEGKALHLQKELVDLEYPLDITEAGTHATFASRRGSRVPSPEPTEESAGKGRQDGGAHERVSGFEHPTTFPGPQILGGTELPGVSHIPLPLETATGSVEVQDGVSEEELQTARPGPHPSFKMMPEVTHFQPYSLDKCQPALQERYQQTIRESRELKEMTRVSSQWDHPGSIPMPLPRPARSKGVGVSLEAEESRQAIQELLELEERRRGISHQDHPRSTSRSPSRPASPMSFSDEIASRKAPAPPIRYNATRWDDGHGFHAQVKNATMASGGWNVAQNMSFPNDGYYPRRPYATGSRSSSSCSFFPTRTLDMQVEY
ncbi:hypothetical protein EST38_g7210 [Candolleomyces aberdarensis]|uniref:G domain-containing protein n=1 Tax=Candolleomyces aberdarensis TaxID=2316362 RepID=A0A4Q2DFQ8_9AGAR|nr:hypothetical protein EST38_g7210 [Candolleomyces aberdarensis]